jgi:hypothetical protein
MNKLRKVLRLSRYESILLLVTFSLLFVVRLGLFLLPFQTLVRLLGIVSKIPVQIYQETEVPSKIVRAVDMSSFYMFGNVKCLARALTTQTLLKWHGYAPDFKLGVTRSDSGQLEAHAWVEYEGEVIVGDLYNLDGFVPFASIQWFE